MKILKYIGIILLALILLVVGFLAYSGLFSGAAVEEKEVGPYFFIQKERWGDYAKTPVFLDSMKKQLLAEKITPTTAFGIYYDNPKNVKTDSLHSIIGYILETKDTARIVELRRKQFRIEMMGKTKSMVIEFPMRNQLSIMLGIMKAYPAFEKYRNEKNYQAVPSLEIYESNKILFTMEVRPK